MKVKYQLANARRHFETTRFHLSLVQILIAIFSTSVFACRERADHNPKQIETDLDPNTRVSAKGQVPIFNHARMMMGTLISITIAGESKSKAEPAVEAVFREIQRLESLLSERIENSEISKINSSAGLSPVKVSVDTISVVKAGLLVSIWSDGAFDLSWAALRGLYSFEPGNRRVPKQKELVSRLSLVGYPDIVIDENAKTVMLRRKGMQIGVGAIAKGLALDRASEILKRAGIENYMLFAGGQVQVHGKRGDRLWRVGIRHPRRQEYFAVLEVTDMSISTSGDYERAFTQNGKRWHHILNLQNGLPVDHTSSVTVLSKTGLYADALSTAIFVLGAKRALKMLASAPGKPEVVIVDRDLKLYKSPGIMHQLTLQVVLNQGQLPR